MVKNGEHWIIDDNNGGDNNDYNLMVIDDNRLQ